MIPTGRRPGAPTGFVIVASVALTIALAALPTAALAAPTGTEDVFPAQVVRGAVLTFVIAFGVALSLLPVAVAVRRRRS